MLSSSHSYTERSLLKRRVEPATSSDSTEAKVLLVAVTLFLAELKKLSTALSEVYRTAFELEWNQNTKGMES